MPVISMFYGLIVRMYYFDTQKHQAPHIHVEYGEQRILTYSPRLKPGDCGVKRGLPPQTGV